MDEIKSSINLLDLTEEELIAIHTPVELDNDYIRVPTEALAINILDKHLYQLNALSVPYNKYFVESAKLAARFYDPVSKLSTGEDNNLGGYLLQMINVFGEDSVAAEKARKQIEIYGADYVPPEDELSYSYFLGLAFVENNVEHPMYRGGSL